MYGWGTTFLHVLVRRLYWKYFPLTNALLQSDVVGKEYEKVNNMVQRCTKESKSRTSLEGI